MNLSATDCLIMSKDYPPFWSYNTTEMSLMHKDTERYSDEPSTFVNCTYY